MLPPGAVCLDVQGAQNAQHFDRGIPRYVLEQARGVLAAAPDAVHSVALNPHRPLPSTLEWLLGTGLLEWNRLNGPPNLPAIYHVMSPFELDGPLEAQWPAWAQRDDVRTVITLYDLIPLVFADHYLRSAGSRARYMARLELVRRADHILAISQATAADAVELLGISDERITVVDAGVTSFFGGTYVSDEHAWNVIRERFAGIRPGYLFYVAGIDFRKNIERLIEAYGLIDPELRARHQLVITCRMLPPEAERLEALARAAGLRRGEVVLTNYVTDLELAALYRVCRLFVFASFYEGSGLPMLEAMAAGVPVCGSATSTGPEVLGDLEATFDPHDAADMARVITATVQDDALLDRLRERSARRVKAYTWESVAEKTVAGYERTLARPPRRPRSRRARLALWTPWPPERSGIAGYNRRLVAELGRDVDVVVVTAGAADEYPVPQEPGTSLVGAATATEQLPLRAVDRSVYCMGNSHFHRHIFEALRGRPGVVVAHDVRLSGFYGWLAGQVAPGDPHGWYATVIRQMYGDRLGALAGRVPTAEEQERLGLYMTHDLQESADRILVHSEHAADILRVDAPLHWRGGGAPTDVVPLAFPDVVERPARQRDPAAPLIVSFGIVHPVKQPALLIEAAARLAADRPGLRLIFAGGAGPEELAPCRRLADELGVSDRVEFPGHVETAEWDRLVAEADVAVQLRQVSNGEASAAVTECLAAGLPTVVTDRGWFSELPDDVVVKVPAESSAARLATEVASIVDDPDRAAGLTAAAQDHARAVSFAAVAQRYLEILELV